MPKGFNLHCAAGKTARVWLQGKGGGLKAGQAMVLLPPMAGENEESPVAYRTPLRQALNVPRADRGVKHQRRSSNCPLPASLVSQTVCRSPSTITLIVPVTL